MAKTDTIRAVARPRGELTDEQTTWLADLRALADKSQAHYKYAIVYVLEKGASFSEVSKATGLSTNTLQRWKREAGK